MNITAKVVPFSSVVGSSVTLHDESGKVVCQLALLNTGPMTDDAEEWKRRQTSFAEEIADRLNAPQPSGTLPGKDVGDDECIRCGQKIGEPFCRLGILGHETCPNRIPSALVSRPHPEALIRNAQALLDLDAKGVLVPHGIGGLAREIISAFIALYLHPALHNEGLVEAAKKLLMYTAPSDGRSYFHGWKELNEIVAALSKPAGGVK